MARLPAIRQAEQEFARRKRLKMPLSYRLAEQVKNWRSAAVMLAQRVKAKRNKAGLRLVVDNTGLRR